MYNKYQEFEEWWAGQIWTEVYHSRPLALSLRLEIQDYYLIRESQTQSCTQTL